MTWDEFKKEVEAAGVQPGDEIDYIDIGMGSALDIEQVEVAGERHFYVTGF